jgi:hypothetical protein
MVAASKVTLRETMAMRVMARPPKEEMVLAEPLNHNDGMMRADRRRALPRTFPPTLRTLPCPHLGLRLSSLAMRFSYARTCFRPKGDSFGIANPSLTAKLMHDVGLPTHEAKRIKKSPYNVCRPFLTGIRARVLGPTPCWFASSRSRIMSS